MCFVWLSEQTVTFDLYIIESFFYNRNGECLYKTYKSVLKLLKHLFWSIFVFLL